jgi:uncharacterized protein YehS (DUF1456 family)
MKTNRILYKIKEALDLSEDDILEIYALEGFDMKRERLKNLLAHPKQKHFTRCGYDELGIFLDGLITKYRGPSPKKPREDAAVELTNNLVLKKLRIALKLEEMETAMIFAMGGAELSKQELKSLFRKETHKNFKACGDDLLDAFLEGLIDFYYDEG